MKNPEFNRLVIFGDSLSDTGKMFRKSKEYLPASPPYYKGRFSDGPVWVDYLQQHINVPVINEAEGGATVVDYNDHSWNPAYDVINNLTFEVKQFTKKYQFTPLDLVVVWGGANDYLTFEWNAKKDANRLVEYLCKEVSGIISKGAGHVLLFNLPDIGKSPTARKEDLEEEATEIANYHNALLEKTCKDLFNQERVRIFDIASQFNELLKKPSQLDIVNVTEPCYKGSTQWTPWLDTTLYPVKENDPLPFDRLQMNALQHNKLLSSALGKPNKHNVNPACPKKMFWDHSHPSTKIHHFLADRFGSFLKENYTFSSQKE